MKQKIIDLIGAFIAPIMIMCIVLNRGGYFPFGDISLVYHDMEYQYVDFFMFLHKVLEGKDSLLYSFNAGLGGETVALWAYYLASPLNVLLLFSPIEKMAQFLSLLIVLKIACCGVTAYVYLKKRFDISYGWAMLISTSYALMGYNILQSSNVMWLDGVITLPLVALGIYELMYKDKKILYFVSLAYAIFSNWYMGYMICIATVLIFVCEMGLIILNMKTSINYTIRKMAQYIIASILGVMASCVLFLPQTLQMMKQGNKIDWANVLQPNLKFSYLEGFRTV